MVVVVRLRVWMLRVSVLLFWKICLLLGSLCLRLLRCFVRRVLRLLWLW